jgi:iron complex transport system permease protein
MQIAGKHHLGSTIINESNLKRTKVIWLAGALLPISFLLALSFGTVSIPFIETLASFCNAIIGAESVNRSDLVIQQIRMPRALLAAFVGALLGISGATTQGLFRNPLADPSLIGVTAGASAGAALTIFFAGSLTTLSGFSGLSLVSGGAFIGGSISVIIVYRLATNTQGTSVATMLLAGIAITALAGSLTNILEFFGDEEMLRRISLWRMGGLDGASYERVAIVAIFSAVILFVLPRFSTALNALLLGESEARHLGLAVQSIKIKLVLLVAAGVGVSVALAGTIAFIGLIIPHMVRILIGPDHRYLLPVSALGGAILLLLSDTIARTIVSPIELPVGLVTAILGAPFFISLLRRRHEFGMQ